MSRSNGQLGDALLQVVAWLIDQWTAVLLIIFPSVSAISFVLMTDECRTTLAISEPLHATIRAFSFGAGLIATVVCVAVAIFDLRQRQRISVLTAERDEARKGSDELLANAKSLCNGYLQDLAAGALGFGAPGQNTDRITLYIFDSLERFQPVGRFSFNTCYLKQGRSSYHRSQGVIGDAWKDGWKFVTMPKASDNLEGWIAECESQGMPRRIAKGIGMKSAIYCACTVRPKGSRWPTGVLVVESTSPSRFTEESLLKVLTEDRRNYMGRMLENLRPWLGDEGNAQAKGL